MILSKPSLHPFDWLEKNDGEQFLAGKFELSFRIYDPGSNTKCRVMVNVNRDHLLQFVKKPARNLTTFFNECGVFLVNKIGLFCSNNTYVLIMNLINNNLET